MKEYLKISEAAKLIGVSSETLRRWDKSGKFESVRHPVNNYRVYSESSVLSMVEDVQLELQYKYKKELPLDIDPYFHSGNGLTQIYFKVANG